MTGLAVLVAVSMIPMPPLVTVPQPPMTTILAPSGVTARAQAAFGRVLAGTNVGTACVAVLTTDTVPDAWLAT